MEKLAKFFPFAFKGNDNQKNFVWGIVIHAVVMLFAPMVATAVAGIIGFVLGLTIILAPLAIVIAGLLGFCGSLVSLYALVSLIIKIVTYVQEKK